MGNGRYGEAGISTNVETQMGHLLNRVREKSRHYENEHDYIEESDSDEQENMQYYDEHDYLDDPPGKWEVRYDNQNYIQSMVNEDKGLHRITGYPKQKWEISYDDHPSVQNLEPYPVRVSIDHHDDDEMAQWHIPYDNRNYVLSMLAGTGISKTWEDELLNIERIRERHGNLRNPYDCDSPQDEIIHSSYRELRPRRDSYRFDRVERNIHDYESESIPEDEITRPHARDQRRRTTQIYRYGDVPRNIHDIAEYGYSRSSPRHGMSAQQGTKTHYDAINKWKNAMQSSDHEKQNLYNRELERHYNQYGVEASAHDYDENRAIRAKEAKKRIVPMSFVNILRKPGNTSGRLKQVAERYRNQLQDNVPVPSNMYERTEESSDDDHGGYDHLPAAGSLYEDVIEEHQDHPYDYGTTHEDSYKEFKEGDGSQTWISSSEKFAQIHHRSQ